MVPNVTIKKKIISTWLHNFNGRNHIDGRGFIIKLKTSLDRLIRPRVTNHETRNECIQSNY